VQAESRFQIRKLAIGVAARWEKAREKAQTSRAETTLAQPRSRFSPLQRV